MPGSVAVKSNHAEIDNGVLNDIKYFSLENEGNYSPSNSKYHFHFLPKKPNSITENE